MPYHPSPTQDAAPTRPSWSSLAGLIEDVLTPAELESHRCFDHALRIGRTLPAELAEWLYFEDRGGSHTHPMDFIVGVGEGGRRVLAGHNPALSVPDSLARDPVWAGIAELARRWSAPPDPLSAIERIWLEFDAGAPTGASIQPSPPGVFVDPPRSVKPSAYAPATLSALECVVGRALPQETRRAFLELSRRLPEGVALPYAGVFPSRDPNTVRACLVGISPNRLANIVPSLGPLDELVELTSRLDRHWHGRPAAAAAAIHVDLGPTATPAIGLEYAFDRRAQGCGRIAEWRFLETLEAMGLLRRDSLGRCGRWPASTRASLRHRLSPSVLLRRVAHVKMVWQAGDHPHAKLYLASWHTPLHRTRPPSMRGVLLRGTTNRGWTGV